MPTALRGWMPKAASEIRTKMRKHWWSLRYQPGNQETAIVKILAKHFATWVGEPAEMEASLYALECRRDELEGELARAEQALAVIGDWRLDKAIEKFPQLAQWRRQKSSTTYSTVTWGGC